MWGVTWPCILLTIFILTPSRLKALWTTRCESWPSAWWSISTTPSLRPPRFCFVWNRHFMWDLLTSVSDVDFENELHAVIATLPACVEGHQLRAPVADQDRIGPRTGSSWIPIPHKRFFFYNDRETLGKWLDKFSLANLMSRMFWWCPHVHQNTNFLDKKLWENFVKTILTFVF